jgi:hypothetical protein
LDRQMLGESEIKAAVIDYLFAKGMLKDAVLINEMVIANWSRRADLAVANGRLYGFEIKSDLDSLKRLDGQLATYISRFDKVIVVASTRWIPSVLERVPRQVEVWEVKETVLGAEIKVARRGHIQEVISPQLLCGYLHKTEIASFLRKEGFNANTDMPRTHLVELTRATRVRRLRVHVLKSLKTRYETTFNAFLKGRRCYTRPENIKKLSKLNLVKQEPTEVFPIESAPFVEGLSRLNLELLEKKYGPLPAEMPTAVLNRRVKSF